MKAIRFTAQAFGADTLELHVLLADGKQKKLTAADRAELLTKLRAGEHVELSFRATTYYQSTEGHNRNFIRFKPSIMAKLAKSFTGQVFLRDHGQSTLDDRGGTIVSSELVKTETEQAIEMEIKAVKPWAVAGLLDGTIDRFSIGWYPTAPVVCSVHKKTIRGKDGCYCWPGDVVEGATVEAIFTGADGVEVSAVNVPAVPEAQGVEIRAALSALAEQSERESATKRKGEDMNRIATHLGLSGAATEDEILTALRKLTDDKVGADVRLAAEVAAHGLVKVKLAEVEAEKVAAQAAAIATKVDAAIEQLYAGGKLPIARDTTGVRVPHPLEGHLREMVKTLGYDAFVAYSASLPKVANVGAPLQLLKDGKEPNALAALANPTVRSMALAGGVTEDDIVKYGGLGVLAEGGV